MSSRSLSLSAGSAVTVAVLAAAWLFFAPTQIGGRTSYAVVSGNSMEPMLHRGDLVVTRKRDRYVKGDVVLFDSVTLDAQVLHRIVTDKGERFVTKGDNNDFLDSDEPVPSQVRGELWFSLDGAGSYLSWLQKPLNIAIAAFLLTLLVLGGGRQAARRRTGGGSAARPAPVAMADPRPEAGQLLRGVLVAGVTALGLFGALAVVAWTRPEIVTREVAGAYVHTGELGYSASPGKSAVYPSGRVETGDPVFNRVVKALDVTFSYRLEASTANIHGTIALEAVLGESTGWTRTIPLASARPFSGPSASVTGRLRPLELRRATERMRRLTGSMASSFTLNVRPVVRVAGIAASSAIDETFAPEIPFAFDSVSLRVQKATEVGPDGVETGQTVAAALAVREEGSAPVTETATVGAGPVRIGLDEARAFGGIGVAFSTVIAGLAALLLARRLGGGNVEWIAARYGSRMVAVDTVIPEGRWITDLPNIEALVHVADRYDRVILHSTEGLVHSYLVDDGVAVYRYRVASAASTARKPSPAGA